MNDLAATSSSTALADASTAKTSATPTAVYLLRLNSKESRRTVLSSLQMLARKHSSSKADAFTFPWHRLRYAETQAVRAWLMQRYSPATVNRHLAALRGVLKSAWRLRLMTEDDYRRAADVEAMKAERPLAGRMLAREEVAQLFDAAAAWPSPRGERDSALMAMSYCLGLRRFEVAGLQLGDVDSDTGAVTVQGKGGKVRTVYLPPTALMLVGNWREARGRWAGPLLTPFGKHGNVLTRGLATSGVEFVLAQLGRAARVSNFTPHDLRRTFISELLDRGVDLVTVMKLAGHSRPQTTAAYDRRGEQRKREAAVLVEVPQAGAS